MTFVPGINVFSFRHGSDPPQYHNRSKPGNPSKQKPDPESQSTLRPEAALEVAEPQWSVLRQIIKSFGVLYIARIMFREVADIFPCQFSTPLHQDQRVPPCCGVLRIVVHLRLHRAFQTRRTVTFLTPALGFSEKVDIELPTYKMTAQPYLS
jgi:hypothetical protein